jgi:FMN phosphatase YigB (HAD superfamily)
MVLLTNTAEKRARIALECLGLSEHFDAVYGADFMRPYCKPEEAAFEKVGGAVQVEFSTVPPYLCTLTLGWGCTS